MNKKYIFTGVFILLLAVIVGGVWCWENGKNKEQKSVQQMQDLKGVSTVEIQQQAIDCEESEDDRYSGVIDVGNASAEEISSVEAMNLSYVDISSWKIYRNENMGFEVNLPEKMVVKEVNKNEATDLVLNRYVSFFDPDNEVTIYLGVRRESENSVMPRPYRTGIPGGEFFSRGVVPVGGGVAEERRLINCYFKENRCVTELIWFCDVDNCDNFVVSDGRVAFLEVIPTSKTNLIKMERVVHGVIRSFKLIE